MSARGQFPQQCFDEHADAAAQINGILEAEGDFHRAIFVGENVPVAGLGQGILDYFRNSLPPNSLHLTASGRWSFQEAWKQMFLRRDGFA